MKILFNIGDFPVHLFGAMIALGILAGFYIMLQEAKRKGLNKDKLMDLAIYTVVVGVIGARINYILAFNPSYYLQNPIDILKIHEGGLSIQGSLIAGTIFALWYMKKKDIPIWRTADAFAPAIILGQAIGRIGCDVFGVPMNKSYFWGVEVAGNLLHPAQLYEAVLNYILFLVLWQKRKHIKYDGQIFMMYIIGFSINRFIVEFFRSNPMVTGNLSIAHIYSIIIILVALLFIPWLKKSHEKLQSTVANDTTSWNMDWRNTGVVIAATIVSIMLYYFFHNVL
ncbi:MAG: prolipoprotein diacylglyceryl transferase [Clostridiaceae bacterium]|nr:prolipoprotein diacylglyceryl transferase [Clostridiaceae bacterium]